MIDGPWIFLAMLVAVIVTSQFVIKLEEEKLTRTFGEAYRSYLNEVRRWV